MNKKDIPFNWNKFNVKHDSILIDVYRNKIFEERIRKEPECESIVIENSLAGDFVYLKIFPDNGGSIYQDDFIVTDTKTHGSKPTKLDPPQPTLNLQKPSISFVNRSVINSDEDFVYLNIYINYNIFADSVFLKFFKNKDRSELDFSIESDSPNTIFVKYPKDKITYLSIESFNSAGAGKDFLYDNIFEYQYR